MGTFDSRLSDTVTSGSRVLAATRWVRGSLCVLAFSLLALSLRPASAVAEDVRIYSAIQSSQQVLDDLEYVVSKLAGKKDIYQNQVYPNVEIFLIGVDLEHPIRFDTILDSEGKRRLSMAVPIADEKDFIRDNVNPIGIDTRKKGDGLYELGGGVFDGWLQVSESSDGKVTYGVFGAEGHQEDATVPIADLLEANGRILFEEFDVAVLLDETSGPVDARKQIVDEFRKQTLEQIERRPDETDAAFALRNHVAKAQFDRIEALVTGGKRVALGYSTDAEKGQGRSKLVIEALPDTTLAKAVDLVGSEESRFGGVPTIDDPVATGRLSIPIFDERRQRYVSFLEISRPVTLERVDTSEASDELKAARKKFIGLIYDQLLKGADQTFISGFYELQSIDPANPDKGNNVAAGVTTLEGGNVVAILDALPAAVEGASIEKDADKIGDIALHKVSLPGLADSFKDHLGGVTDVYIGVADDAVYFAGGPAGVELLKKSLADLSPAKTDTAFSLRFHAGPVASLLDSVMTKRDFSLIEFLQDRREDRLTEREKDPDEARRVEVGDPREWREAAIKALMGKDGDVVNIEFKKVDGALIGTSELGRAILTAAGELIAKFAEENL